jgi:cell wall-associated protease
MRIVVFTLITLMISTTWGSDKYKTKVAVIDTGYSGFFATKRTKKTMCKNGHYDFKFDEPKLGYDVIGHGTFVTNLIVENAKRDDICILMYKVNEYIQEKTRDHITKALAYAYKQGARVVNISMGDPTFNYRESKVFQRAARKGMKIFVAAGNEGKDMNQMCNIYPGCYTAPNIFTVGNKGSKVQIYEYGTIPGVGRGTSFATPRAVARFLRERK